MGSDGEGRRRGGRGREELASRAELRVTSAGRFCGHTCRVGRTYLCLGTMVHTRTGIGRLAVVGTRGRGKGHPAVRADRRRAVYRVNVAGTERASMPEVGVAKVAKVRCVWGGRGGRGPGGGVRGGGAPSAGYVGVPQGGGEGVRPAVALPRHGSYTPTHPRGRRGGATYSGSWGSPRLVRAGEARSGRVLPRNPVAHAA